MPRSCLERVELGFSPASPGPGYTSGHTWTDQFRVAYRDSYGGAPPIDVWAIHVYDLDWTRVPMVNAQRPEAELTAFEGYVDGLPGPSRPPIWLTEFGVIWGYDALVSTEINGSTVLLPYGTYQQSAVDGYISEFVGWLGHEGPPSGSSVRFCMRR